MQSFIFLNKEGALMQMSIFCGIRFIISDSLEEPASTKMQFFRISALMDDPASTKMQFSPISALMDAPASTKWQFSLISCAMELTARTNEHLFQNFIWTGERCAHELRIFNDFKDGKIPTSTKIHSSRIEMKNTFSFNRTLNVNDFFCYT